MSEEIPIWRVKYLPKNLDEVCGRKDVIDRFKEMIKAKNFPHLLLVGPGGIGKTTISKLFSREFLGRYFDSNFKLIYADIPLTPDERKQAKSEAYISTSKIGSLAGKRITTPAFIQIKVKPFVELKAIGEVPFKILMVKNFDSLGMEQQGFRRLMEIYGTNCRMILIATKISNIIDPIISRCQLLLISPANYESFKGLIQKIGSGESLKIDDHVINTIYKLTEGKLSKAIDLLQLCSLTGDTIDLEKLHGVAQKFQNELIRSLLLVSLKGDFSRSRELARKIIAKNKYSSHKLFAMLLKEINKLPLSQYSRIQLINLISEADMRAIDGRDDDIQISALLSKICLFSDNL
ncbi:MAG: hypothetical protein EU542_07530 [Promethearchaeota archaeon]|nr:MAG: hypothetical protein EU542_07530 [Candidatus Lokiarchaeota archaeon]